MYWVTADMLWRCILYVRCLPVEGGAVLIRFWVFLTGVPKEVVQPVILYPYSDGIIMVVASFFSRHGLIEVAQDYYCTVRRTIHQFGAPSVNVTVYECEDTKGQTFTPQVVVQPHC